MLAFNVLLLGFTGTGHRGSRCLFLLLELVWTLIRHWFLLHLSRVSGSILTAGYFTFFISTLILRSFGESHLSLSSRPRYNTSYFFWLMFAVWRFLGVFWVQVRVPRLNGERKGVFATRSPHRPCPIGLTVAKVLWTQHISPVVKKEVEYIYQMCLMVVYPQVEEIQKDKVLLSGVDLVDGTVTLFSLCMLNCFCSLSDAWVVHWLF